MEEIWRDIKDYEGYYQISNFGRVKSVKRIACDGKHINERILKGGLREGYVEVTLSKNNVTRTITVHKLVCNAFIENPNKYPCINHKDEIKTNNRVDNLEWCTQKYNANYGTRNKRCGDKHGKRVIQFDLKGNEIKRWISAAEASRHYGKDRTTIVAACRRKSHISCGYVWRYESEVGA